MPAPRRPARRRQCRPSRLVSLAPGSAPGIPALDALEGWEGDGWSIGLRAASYLRTYFSNFWVAHVAQKPLTTSRMLGAFHAFILAIAAMHRHTAWSQGTFPMEAYAVALPPGLPELDARTPMPALAELLRWSCPLPGISQPWELGAILRYAAGATHNHYADYATDELADDGTWWADWVYDNPDSLAREIQLQRGARHLAQVYEALNARVSAEPGLLCEIGQAVAAAAAQIAPAQKEGLCVA